MSVNPNDADLPAGGSPAVPDAELPGDDAGLDDLLRGAIDQHMGGEEPSGEAGPGRDPATGRFVSKNADPVESDVPPAGQPAEAKPVDGSVPPQEGADPTTPSSTAVEVPRNLTAEQKEAFTRLPPEAQRMLADLEGARTADFTRRSQEMAEFRRTAEPLVRAVQPFQGYLDQVAKLYGPQMTPAGLVQQLVQAEYVLRTGSPAEKAQALREIATDYGIDLSPQAGDGQQPQAGPAPDPVVSQLHRDVLGMKAEFQNLRSQQQEQEIAAADAAIAQFRDAKADDGSPKYPFFDLVMQAMGQLMGQQPGLSMEQAYKAAAKPIEERLGASLKTTSEQKAAREREAVERARRAAPPRSTGSIPNGQVQGDKDLDALLKENIGRHF